MVERRFSAASALAFGREPGFNPAALGTLYGIRQAWNCARLALLVSSGLNCRRVSAYTGWVEQP